MLLIPCPYCGPRPELEFRYAGEAHIARAENPSLLDDEAWTAYLYVRSNPKGPHSERWQHVHGSWPVLQRRARHDERRLRRHLSDRRAEAGLAETRRQDRGIMSGAFRLPHGGRVDRTQRLRFAFDGRSYEGLAGDTLASALIANGVHLVGRSFKYHRPRGFLSAGTDEPNALFGVGREAARYTPNLQATSVELRDGLECESQNRWPSLRFDLGAVNDALARLLPPGFYYKTFMWPAAAWKRLYEPLIRAAAGHGRAPRVADADRYSQRYVHCDVLVVGAGPAGLAAANAAAESGARVILCDEQAELGGSLLVEIEATVDGKPAAVWLAETVAALSRRSNVTLLPRTTAFGCYPHNFIALVERVTDHLTHPDPHLPRERLWQVRAREVVFSTGAIERPLVFPDNDRPGIMLAEAARTYINRYAAKPGTRAVVFAAHDGAYRAALDLGRAGVEIAAIADLREKADGALPAAARAAGFKVLTGTVVTGTSGRRRITGMRLAGHDGTETSIACDLLLMSGGLTPNVSLFSQGRGRLRFDDTLKAYVPDRTAERQRSAGACRGLFTLASVLEDGHVQGMTAAIDAGCDRVAPRRFAVATLDAGTGAFIGAVPHSRAPRRVKAFVDFQHDVTTRDLELATREGFQSIEHVKRYTTTGMATDQGKTSNMNALGVVAAALRLPVPQIGLTTFRPPYTPVTFGALAGPSRGELFDPVRTTPTHDWAEANGAAFEDVGTWKRAHYFPRRGETMHDAVARECLAVREIRGDVRRLDAWQDRGGGPDAAEFLNRIYTNAWTGLAPGRLRYGVMLREDGFVLDDGVVGRLAPERFHVTTTTGGVSRVLQLMEDYLQTEWPHLDVLAHSDDRAMGGDRRAGTRCTARLATALPRYRHLDAGNAAHERAGGPHMRRPGAAVPGELHRRARFRDQCSGRPRSRRLGGRLRGGRPLRHHALRHRDHARAARREGLHHRRSGDRRHRHARQRRARLGDWQSKEGFRRQARAGAARHDRP